MNEFSLVLGGPLYQLFVKLRLLRPPLDLVKRRIILVSLFCWLPLLLLSILDGKAFDGCKVPFFFDFEVHIRFLIALPLLIAAEVGALQWLGSGVRQFVEREIVREEDRSHFNALIESTIRQTKSTIAEIFLFIFVFTVGHYLWMEQFSVRAETWYASRTTSGQALSLAGNWLVWISVPIFQFMAYRWFYRLILWFIFLWRVSRMDLHLIPTHPDRAGSLGFLSNSTYAFTYFLVAQGALVSGMIANRIFHEGEKLTAFKVEIFGSVALGSFLVLGPLVVFSSHMFNAKRRGRREYSLLANRYMRLFDTKWLRGGAAEEEPLIGSSDIQSLADIGNSYQVVRDMNILPFGKDVVMRVALTIAAPMFPLVLTMIPFEELLVRILRTVF